MPSSQTSVEPEWAPANRSRSAIQAFAHSAPGVDKWTKWTVAEHITIGGMGATPVGTPQYVADVMEKWVNEADVDGFNLVRIYSA